MIRAIITGMRFTDAIRPAHVAVIASLALIGCGGSDGVNTALLEPGQVPEAVTAAEQVDLSQFPPLQGRTLEQLLQVASARAQIGLGSGSFTPSERNRVAFAVLGQQGAPIYGQTVIYVAPTPGSPARGPFPAPLDPMVPQQKFLSRQAAVAPEQLKAIYAAEAPLDRPGNWAVLSLTRTPEGLVAGTTTQLKVGRSSTIPEVGEEAPKIETPTGAVSTTGTPVDTRDPKAPSLHEVDFAQVVGRKPVAILFASPQFCLTKVCGPVTDLLLQLQAAWGDRVAMIQQEPYSKFPDPGQQMKQFGLVAPDGAFTEPWMFTVAKDGRIAARLEGAFGINEMNGAIEAAAGPD